MTTPLDDSTYTRGTYSDRNTGRACWSCAGLMTHAPAADCIYPERHVLDGSVSRMTAPLDDSAGGMDNNQPRPWRQMPRKPEGGTPMRHIRIPDDIFIPAAELANTRGETISTVVRRLLREYGRGESK